MPNGGPGMWSDLAVVTVARREKPPRLSSVSGPSPGLFELYFRRLGQESALGMGKPHTSRVHLMITQEVEALGLTNATPERGGEGPSGGVSRACSLKALSFPSSNRMPGAPQKRDSFVFIPSTITCCWPFSWALLRATGYSLCQERRKARREGGMTGAQNLPAPQKTQNCEA